MTMEKTLTQLAEEAKTLETKDGCRNCVDLTDNTLRYMGESDCVYKVQSAELNITN